MGNDTMIRILPRDAFNDANLLKCIGRLTLLIEDGVAPGWEYLYDGEPFRIMQDPADGSTYVANVHFHYKGEYVLPFRPLNSREDWPLLVLLDNGDEVEIFDNKGGIVI